MRKVRAFVRSECGTVTVDWVMLGALALAAAVATVATVKDGAVSIGPRISAEIEQQLS